MKAFSNLAKTCLLPLFFLAVALLSPSFTFAGEGTKQAEKINKEAKEYSEDVENSGAKKAITEDFADAVKKLGEDNPDDAAAVKKGACEKLEALIEKHKNNKEIQKILRQLKKHLRTLKLIDCGDEQVQGANPNAVGMNATASGTLTQAGGGTAAAVDYYLKLEGVEGENTASNSGHGEWIEINSVQFGAFSPDNLSRSAGSGGGAGKASFQDLSFTVKVAKATPQLMQACATGKHFPSATLVCRKAGSDPQTYLQYELENVMISSFQTGGGGGGSDRPMESLSLNFTKIEFCKVAQGEKRVVFKGGR